MEVIAEAGVGAEAVRLAHEHHPDVALMDIRVPGMDGLTATRRIGADPRLADTKITMLTTFELDEYVFEAKEPRIAACLDLLTEREREVLTLVGGGMTNDEIAAMLYLSPATAKTHASRTMMKLQARDRAQLVVIAYESGLVKPGWRRGRSAVQVTSNQDPRRRRESLIKHSREEV
ncbi:DNA-binding response regulator [Sphaerimonospora thailandensis]|uniref:DNA-binding response regulator n=2 Tax=Sphaerimonospora thailandensis TaxID=795644 RepID=A0A8J3R6U0_9ACTN|nr:DNA-binding response regulator [Sphaerimonospora thailandensis]